METPIQAHVALAEELGFKTAAANINADYDLAKKLLVAYASYSFITKEAYNRFNAELKRKTVIKTKDRYETEHYKTLAFDSLADYPHLPPTDVMLKIREARSTKLFDRFTIAYIKMAHVPTRDPDPIVFGIIEGTSDLFFIAEWGDDVSLSDILAAEKAVAK
jgi:hypothetical protein